MADYNMQPRPKWQVMAAIIIMILYFPFNHWWRASYPTDREDRSYISKWAENIYTADFWTIGLTLIFLIGFYIVVKANSSKPGFRDGYDVNNKRYLDEGWFAWKIRLFNSLAGAMGKYPLKGPTLVIVVAGLLLAAFLMVKMYYTMQALR